MTQPPKPIERELLGYKLTNEQIERTKQDLDGEATEEVLLMATLFRMLAEDTMDHADDLDADGATFRAEEVQVRAEKYKSCYFSICEEWPSEKHEE